MRTRYATLCLSFLIMMLMMVTGCAPSSDLLQKAMGRDILIQRAKGEGTCPTISTFTVSPEAVRCGDAVTLELGVTTLFSENVSYSWEIEGQTFETGQRAVWKTPTCKTIDDPERSYTVRGVVSSGSCDVTQVKEVNVLCNCALDVMVNFDFAKSKLDATATIQLDKIGEKLQEDPRYSILIEGHTDFIGSNKTNMSLGTRRADAVKQYLISTWNIKPGNIIIRSYGEEEPVASNDTAGGRAQNRRAEIFRVILQTK